MTLKTTTLRTRAAQAAILTLLASAPPCFAQDAVPAAEEDAAAAPAPAEPDPAAEPAQTVETIPVGADEEADKEATKLETLEVTGSRIRRTDYETAQPIAVISRADIERTGLTSIGDILQELPQAGSALNTNFNGFTDVGGTEVDLRNLGANRVLVLVNGHRWVNGLRSLGTNIVDLSTVPVAIIERIEVLKDGASAIYGSDAVAGVVNIVTRKDFVGSSLKAYAGNFLGYGDGLTQSYNASYGNLFGKTSVFVDGSFTTQQPVVNADRELTEYPIYGTGVTRGSSNSPQGRIVFIPEDPATTAGLNASDPDACNNTVLVPAGAPGVCNVTPRSGTNGATFADFRAWDPLADPYNFYADFQMLTPYDQGSLFGQVAHELTDIIDLRGEFLYNQRKSEQLIAGSPLPVGDLSAAPFNAIYVDATNPFNPFGQDIGRAAAGAGAPLGPGSGLVARRPVEEGDRIFSQTVDTMRGGLTVGGPLELAAIGIDTVANWEVGYTYAESKEKETSSGLFRLDRLAQALGPLADCLDPCVPMNFFGGQGVDGGGTITQEMLDYTTYTDNSNSRATTKDLFANLSTELGDFFGNGPIGMALGFEFRREHYEQNPDPLVQAGVSSTNQAVATRGGYDAKETYLELALPLARDARYAREIDLSVAARHSAYGDLGKSDTYKLGLRWKPADNLLLRGTMSTAFRAPSVGELYLGDSVSYPAVIDPCSADVRTGPGTPEGRDANCADVPTTYAQISAQVVGLFQGNEDLKPETADTMTFGFVFSPEFAQDRLNLYVDWYRISVDDYITVVGEQSILDRCYDQGEGNGTYCENIHRSANGGIERIDNPFVNFAKLDTAGVDVAFDYALPWFKDLGNPFKLVGDASYLQRYDLFTPLPDGTSVKDPDATPGRHAPALLATFPRLKANVSLVWSDGPWSGSWSTRYIHHVRESCNDTLTPTFRDLGLCSDPDPDVADDDPSTPLANEHVSTDASENVMQAVFLHSVQAGYNFEPWGTKFTVGVNNVLDQDPPPSYGFVQSPGWEYGGGYDTPGRFGYLQVLKAF